MSHIRTTYDEISTCPALNRAFWSDRARSTLASMKEPGANIPMLRRAFRTHMASRRNQEYLIRGVL